MKGGRPSWKNDFVAAGVRGDVLSLAQMILSDV
jgi:hypothetical protein